MRKDASPSRWLAGVAVGVAVFAGIMAGFALLLAAVDYHAPQGSEPPKITDWMQGWGSVVAVVAGLGAAAITGALLLHERREARLARAAASKASELAAEERRDAEATQARSVILGDLLLVVEDVAAPDGRASLQILSLRSGVLNYSAAPILDVRVSLTGSGPLYKKRRRISDRSVLGPGDSMPAQVDFDPPVQTEGMVGDELKGNVWVQVRARAR